MINLAVFILFLILILLLFTLLIYGSLQLVLLPPQAVQQLAAALQPRQPLWVHKVPPLRGRT